MVLIRAALRRAVRQVRHVRPVRPETAHGLVARVYRQVERDFGMLAPPMALHSPAPEVLAAAWMMLRESLLADGVVDRATKEVVATEVSAGNSCPYCVEVHGSTLRGLGQETTEGVIGTWAEAIATEDGAARSEVTFPGQYAAELGAVAVTFHYLNRMVNVFLPKSPLPRIPATAWLLGQFLKTSAGKAIAPGDALELLPKAASTPEPGANPWLADAFGRAAAAIDRAGQRAVPAAVRELVCGTLATWDGRPPGPGRSWVAEATAGLAGEHRPAGRLALLTAIASYQVDDSAVADFRLRHRDDSTLIELTAWSSLVAARRIGSWIPTATHQVGGHDQSR
jgi:AhpD family alkylhydroperoxidase